MQIKQALNLAQAKLRAVNIENPFLEARILLAHALEKKPEYLLAYPEELIDPEEFWVLLERRVKHEPIAYIIGRKEFYGRDFFVNDSVLIPRSDTEILVESVLGKKWLHKPKILELGVGSGCIIITLLLEMPIAQAVAVDLSHMAMECARDNAANYNVIDLLDLRISDWFSSINSEEKFDIIISNPPYISLEETTLMAEETIKYEPSSALFSEDKGLAAYMKIARNAKDFLIKGGSIFLEVGYNQANQVKEIFTSLGYNYLTSYNDLAGHERCIEFSRN